MPVWLCDFGRFHMDREARPHTACTILLHAYGATFMLLRASAYAWYESMLPKELMIEATYVRARTLKGSNASGVSFVW